MKIKIFSLCIILFTAMSINATNLNLALASEDTLYKSNLNYKILTGMYDIYRTTDVEIVMLGNSITHGVNWAELLNRHDIVERGIPSDNLSGYLQRMNYIYKLHPRLCYVMGGINDIYSGIIPLDEIYKNYKKVIEGLKLNKIIPVIQSTLYVSNKYPYALEKNQEVEKLNDMLKKYAIENKIEFIDLNAELSFNKFLKNYLTYDGLHLNGEAYSKWRLLLDKSIKKYGL
ncbi:MAG: GDSL-type esterase/lipase family protein [Ignavibacteria bacterium]